MLTKVRNDYNDIQKDFNIECGKYEGVSNQIQSIESQKQKQEIETQKRLDDLTSRRKSNLSEISALKSKSQLIIDKSVSEYNEIIDKYKDAASQCNDKILSINNIVGDHIACVNSSSKLLIFKIEQLPVLKKGGGVQLQKIKNNEFLSDIQIFHLSDGISWRTGSKIKNEKNINFWIGKRSQSGKKIPKRFNKELKFNNP